MTSNDSLRPADDAPTVPGRLLKLGGALVVLALLVLAVRRFGPGLQPYLEGFLGWVDSLGLWAPVVYIAGYAVATVALIPGSILTMAGGVLFGLWKGTLFVFCGATLGASAAFLVSRYVARGAIEKRLEGNERFETIDRAVGRNGLKIVFLLRLVPFFPFVWLNYGLGLTRVRFRDYVLGCFGMLPGTFLYVYYGKAIGSLARLAEGDRPEQGWERYAVLGLGLVAAIVVTTLITRIARRALEEETGAAAGENETTETAETTETTETTETRGVSHD